MTDFNKARKNMVDGQIHTAGVVDTGILNAFETTPRESFVPEKLKSIAYTDENIDLGQGRFLLEPIVHSKMLQAVLPTTDDTVLEIGSASGYGSAILSQLVTTVFAVENNKRQMDKAVRVWEAGSYCNIVQIEGELEDGAPEHKPYSLIVINGAVEEIPQNIFDQLATGGRLVTVVTKPSANKGMATLFVKSHDGNVSSKPLFDAGIPVLAEFKKKIEFQF